MCSNVYITIQSNQVHELLFFVLSHWRASCSLAACICFFNFKTIATTLYLYMWLKRYVLDIV